MFVKRIYVDWIFEGLKSWDQNFNIGSRLQCGKVTSLEIVMKKNFKFYQYQHSKQSPLTSAH
jgi:hypothetical protein